MNTAESEKLLQVTGRLPAEARAQLAHFRELLLISAERVNVTAIRNPDDVEIQHFADSLAALAAEPFIRDLKDAADIGSGGGLPLIPLAIALPDSQWTAIESVGKKCTFITSAAGELGISSRVSAFWGRAEELAQGDRRESFDLATARAVGPVVALCEVGLPLLRLGGRLLLYKTASAEQEWHDAAAVLQELGGNPLPEFRYRLPGDRQDRIIFRAEKIAPTPAKYPRAPGIPFKRPLQLK